MPAAKSSTNVNTMPADKKTATKRTPAAKAEVVVPVVSATPTVAATPSTPAPSAAASTSTAAAVPLPAETRSADQLLSAIQEHLKSLTADVSSRIRAIVAEAQDATRAIKREARDNKRRRRVDPADMTPEQRATWEARRLNNAFLKMRPLSDELSAFMGLPAKSQRSQTDVTKFVSTYVKTHSCFDPNFKRRIIPDAKLAKLLRVKDSEEVTYLNLQKFLKVHFLKVDTPKTA